MGNDANELFESLDFRAQVTSPPALLPRTLWSLIAFKGLALGST